MYEWSWGIFAKKSKLHDAGGPDTVVSPIVTDYFVYGGIVSGLGLNTPACANECAIVPCRLYNRFVLWDCEIIIV